MHFFNTTVIFFVGLMVGNELAISAFVNPALWQLENIPQAQSLSLLARSLGRVMPVWYGLCLALLTFESVLHRHEAGFASLFAATLIWTLVIVFTIGMLVPINNRVASLNLAAPEPGWQHAHKRWDALHRVRIVLLALALFLLIHALAA